MEILGDLFFLLGDNGDLDTVGDFDREVERCKIDSDFECFNTFGNLVCLLGKDFRDEEIGESEVLLFLVSISDGKVVDFFFNDFTFEVSGDEDNTLGDLNKMSTPSKFGLFILLSICIFLPFL